MKKIGIAVVVLILIVAAVLWSTRGEQTPSTGAEGSAGGARSAGSAAASAGTNVSSQSAGLPAWLIQTDVKPRRIAGRVTFLGAPVAVVRSEVAVLAGLVGLGMVVTGIGTAGEDNHERTIGRHPPKLTP